MLYGLRLGLRQIRENEMLKRFLSPAAALLSLVIAGCAPENAKERKAEMNTPHLTGKIADCAAHENLHPRFAKAFEFLKRPDLAELKVGRYEIDGDNCWASVAEADLVPAAERKLEAHRRYIDIQSPLTGPELMGFAVMDEKAQALPFDVAKDFVLYNGSSDPHVIKPGEYAIFFPPLGAHAPACMAPGGPSRIKKIVVKVLAD
jgi:YhcH/YjgK/YiaL family protein